VEEIQIDWIAVVIAAIVNMIIGFVWYSKWLFGSSDCLKKGDAAQGILPIVWGAALSFAIAFFLAFFEGHLRVTTVSDGMFISFCLWLGFVATTQISQVIWQARPWKLFFIDAGYKFLSFLVMGGILGA
jgi:hypothetical protein